MLSLATLLLLISSCLGQTAVSGAAQQNRPLVLVPGLTGSALEVKLHKVHMPHFYCTDETHDHWMKVWVDPEQMAPKVVDCLIKRLTLIYDADSDTYSNLPGVDLRALGWANGTQEGKSKHDTLYTYEFGSMMTHLTEMLGYALGKDMFIAPYDWRLAGDAHSQATNGVGGFYEQLKTLIEKAVKQQGRRAIVLSHSLGCPTTLYFFHNYVTESWRQEHIHSWVALSGPWMGGATQVSAFLGGWTLGLPHWLLPHDYVKSVQVNASSGIWLSPHPQAFGERPLATTPSRNYTAADLPELISTIGPQAGGQQAVKLFAKLRDPFAELQRVPVNVPLLNWYSTGVKTAARYVYGKDIEEGFNEAPIETIYDDGDGIVNLISLQQVELAWPASQDKIETRSFPNCSHFGVLSDSRVLDALAEYLALGDHEPSLFV